MSIHYHAGDAVEGDRIAIECHKHSDWILDQRTGTHRGTKAKLHDGFCVIETEFEFVKKMKPAKTSGSS